MISNVHFVIPVKIEAGLATGQYERIGGVIRDTQTKKVVMWLREMPTASNNPANILGNALSMTKFGGLVNLGLVAANIVISSQQFDNYTKQLDELTKLTKNEFNHDREIEFRAALETAQGVFTSRDEMTKRQLAAQAVHALLKSVENFIELAEATINSSPIMANVYFSQAVEASAACLSCNLEIEEFDTARQYIVKHMQRLKPVAHQLIEKILGEHQAIYFHSDMDIEEVKRYQRILNWMNPHRSMLDIVESVRKDFWNTSILQVDIWSRIPNFFSQEDIWSKLPIFFNKNQQDRKTQLTNNLTQAELIIENFKRLQGYEMEVRFLRLSGESFSSWRDKLNEYIEDENDAGSLAYFELEEPIEINDISHE